MKDGEQLPEGQAAFVKQFPENLRPFVIGHMQTPTGRADVQAFLDAGTQIEVLKQAAAKGTMQQGMGYDQENNKLVVPEDVFTSLRAERPKDQALFSYMLSNEAAHAIQTSKASNNILTATSQESIKEGTKFGLKMEMASDARSNLNLAERIQLGIVGIDDVPDILNRKGLSLVSDPSKFSQAYTSDGKPSDIAIKATLNMWPLYGARVAAYRNDAIEDAKDAQTSPKEDPNFNDPNLINAVIDSSAGVNGLSESVDPIATRLATPAHELSNSLTQSVASPIAAAPIPQPAPTR